MFSATIGRSCFSLTMSCAPLASLVLVHLGTRRVGAFGTAGALVRISVCAWRGAATARSANSAKCRFLDFARNDGDFARNDGVILLASQDVVATVRSRHL